MKYICVILFFALIGILARDFYLSSKTSSAQYQNDHLSVLTQCIDEEKATLHYMVMLKIVILGIQYGLPDTIGIEDGCLHPIQVHDGHSGQIHVHYLKPFPFTLGDIFTTWGIIFNKTQFAAYFIGNRYSMKVIVNGKANNLYENYILKPGDAISILVSKK